jgi:hypothetical protein
MPDAPQYADSAGQDPAEFASNRHVTDPAAEFADGSGVPPADPGHGRPGPDLPDLPNLLAPGDEPTASLPTISGERQADAGDRAVPVTAQAPEPEPHAGDDAGAGWHQASPGHGSVRPGLPLQAWRGLRDWRRSRPFWAGVFLILSGAEMLLIPLPIHSMGLILHIGNGGVLGILIGALLIACALLLWFNPQQRMFYAIVAVLLAIAALIATNLGGFIIGTLLGVLGGSLGFAWTPVSPEDEPAARRGRRWRGPWERRPARHGDSAGLGLVLGEAGEPAADSGNPAEDGTASGDSFPGDDAPGDAPAAPAQDRDARRDGDGDGYPGYGSHQRRDAGRGGGMYLGIPLLPALLGLIVGVVHPTPSPVATPRACSSPAATATARPHPTRAPRPTTSPSPASTCPTPAPDPTGTSPTGASPTPSPSPSGTGATASPSPTASVSPSPRPSTSKTKRATVSGSVVAAAVPSVITANSATLTGLSYDGVANVQTADGSVPMLKFSMSGLNLAGDDDLTVSEGGHTLGIRASSLDFTGDVTLLTTKFSGDLLGIPLTFTPKSPPPLVLPTMVFTHVVTSQPYTSADALQIVGLLITAS